MTKKLAKIKKDAQEICSDVSSDLRSTAKQLDSVATPPFKNLGDFDAWFYGNKPLTI